MTATKLPPVVDVVPTPPTTRTQWAVGRLTTRRAGEDWRIRSAVILNGHTGARINVSRIVPARKEVG